MDTAGCSSLEGFGASGRAAALMDGQLKPNYSFGVIQTALGTGTAPAHRHISLCWSYWCSTLARQQVCGLQARRGQAGPLAGDSEPASVF